MADRKTLKELFLDDPEMMRVIEQREQTDMLRQMSEKDVSNISEVLNVLEAREQTGLLREIAANKSLMKGEKGDDGFTPVKGEHYFTEEEVSEFLEKATPVKGVHYFDGADGVPGQDGIEADEDKIIMAVLGKIKASKDDKGVSKAEVKAMLSALVEKFKAKDLGAITETDAEEIAQKHAKGVHDKLSQSIATLRGDVMRNYGGHGGGTGTGGTALKVETPVGVVDGINVTFTVSNTPVYISSSGQLMVNGDGYTYAAPTVTFDNAPTQTPHSFFNG